jgi:glycosyltransferase involved in cell wall biosynthesis
MHIAMPVVRNDTGADVYFERLAAALRLRGHQVDLQFLPRFAEHAPWALRHLYRPPAGADLIHTKAEFGSGFVGLGLPVVMTLAHSVFDPAMADSKSPATKLYHRYVKRPRIARSLRGADVVVTVSEHSHRQIRADYGVDTTWIHNGIDETVFRKIDVGSKRENDGKIRLFHVGNLVRRKGAELLPPLMEELGDGFELVYTGGIRQSSKIRPTRHMRSLGFLSLDELVRAYDECDVFVFPSRMEGFGYPVAEAMACEKPVVCFATSSLPELVDERGGFAVPSGDLRAFADAIRALAADPERRRAMGAYNRRKVLERFTLRRSAEQYEALYRSVAREYVGAAARSSDRNRAPSSPQPAPAE